ncbi:helix-turn-helix domain-containing protein [Acidiferrobacter sp.]|jgi:DNA-binding HxlR family transcriptional regulator|uniref:winged helix-turn-helix transcriptional regulator n=1 Tax=Acidiferrobacter sp. TaxID=1872107 RepID=UPI00261E6ADE|nr:helix-turn-helix domain-containing protein [Acidiferrobacter sp.]
METTSPCPVDAVLKLLAGPWTTHVLWVLQTQGALRFGALKRAIPGVSSRLLTERLRRLAGAGFVAREMVASVPPQVTYRLTERGRRLGEVLAQLQPIVSEWEAQETCGAEASGGHP